jgi:hypothetical protein
MKMDKNTRLGYGSDWLEEKHLQEGFGKLVLETRPKVINPFNGKKFDAKLSLENEKVRRNDSVRCVSQKH